MPKDFPTAYNPFDEQGVRSAVRVHPRGFDYLEGHYVIDVLNSIFPLRWSFQLCSEPVHTPASVTDQARAAGSYSIRGRLTIRAEGLEAVVHEDTGVGTYAGELQREKAIKEAATDCLKRCARQLGWQFGNSLYDAATPWDRAPAPLAMRIAPQPARVVG